MNFLKKCRDNTTLVKMSIVKKVDELNAQSVRNLEFVESVLRKRYLNSVTYIEGGTQFTQKEPLSSLQKELADNWHLSVVNLTRAVCGEKPLKELPDDS